MYGREEAHLRPTLLGRLGVDLKKVVSKKLENDAVSLVSKVSH